MIPYIGSGDYCYAYSLYMSLLGSGVTPDNVPSPGFLECLTTMPFGNTYITNTQLFLFDGLDPDQGLTRAIEALGWTCRLERGGDEQEALRRLRAASQHGPVLLGPLDVGYLTYHPNYHYLGGVGHFVVVLAVEHDHVVNSANVRRFLRRMVGNRRETWESTSQTSVKWLEKGAVARRCCAFVGERLPSAPMLGFRQARSGASADLSQARVGTRI